MEEKLYTKSNKGWSDDQVHRFFGWSGAWRDG